MGWLFKNLFSWPEPVAYHARVTANSRRSLPRLFWLWLSVLMFAVFVMMSCLASISHGFKDGPPPRPVLESIGLGVCGAGVFVVFLAAVMKLERRYPKSVAVQEIGIQRYKRFIRFKDMTQCTWETGDGFAVLRIESKQNPVSTFGIPLGAEKARLEEMLRSRGIPQRDGGPVAPESELPRNYSGHMLLGLFFSLAIMVAMMLGYAYAVAELRRPTDAHQLLTKKYFEDLRSDLKKADVPRNLVKRVTPPVYKVSKHEDTITTAFVLFPVFCILLGFLGFNIAFATWFKARIATEALERAVKRGATPRT